MARIVLGMGSSHGPMLSTPPEEWGQRVLADKRNKEHHYKSKTWTYDQLVEARKGENLTKQIELPVWRERHAACRKALGTLAQVFSEVKPDVAVIVGNDQKEIFRDAYTPAISVFYGKTIVNTMFSDRAHCGAAARHRGRDPGAHSTGRCDLSGCARARRAHRQIAGRGRVRRIDPDRTSARRDAARLRLHLPADHARSGGAERTGHPQHVLSAQSAERAALL